MQTGKNLYPSHLIACDLIILYTTKWSLIWFTWLPTKGNVDTAMHIDDRYHPEFWIIMQIWVVECRRDVSYLTSDYIVTVTLLILFVCMNISMLGVHCVAISEEKKHYCITKKRPKVLVCI